MSYGQGRVGSGSVYFLVGSPWSIRILDFLYLVYSFVFSTGVFFLSIYSSSSLECLEDES